MQRISNLGNGAERPSIPSKVDLRISKDNADRANCPQSNKTNDQTPDENPINRTESSSNIQNTLTRKQTAKSWKRNESDKTSQLWNLILIQATKETRFTFAWAKTFFWPFPRLAPISSYSSPDGNRFRLPHLCIKCSRQFKTRLDNCWFGCPKSRILCCLRRDFSHWLVLGKTFANLQILDLLGIGIIWGILRSPN